MRVSSPLKCSSEWIALATGIPLYQSNLMLCNFVGICTHYGKPFIVHIERQIPRLTARFVEMALQLVKDKAERRVVIIQEKHLVMRRPLNAALGIG